MFQITARPQFGWFHLTNLGVDRFDIYDTVLDRVVFENEVRVAAEKFGIEVHAYCWMTNHFHLVVHCPDGQLSLFMQRLQQQYVLKHNRATGRSGPLFVSRFSSFPIGLDDGDPDVALMVLGRYVHRNPLDATRIELLGSWSDSSYGVYLGRRKAPDWLRTDVLLSIFDDDVDRLRRFTETPHPSDRTPASGRRHEPFRLDDVLLGAADVIGMSVTELLTPTPGRINAGRILAALLVWELRPSTDTDIETIFGMSGSRNVRALMAKGKALRYTDPAFAALVARSLEAIWKRALSGRDAA